MKKFLSWILVLIVCLLGSLFFSQFTLSKEAKLSQPIGNASSETLSDSDCIKCHKKEVTFISSAGGKHQLVGCLDCHKGHYPMIAKEKMKPSCSECHSGKDHYTLPNCLGCHQNPHTPLNIVLTGNLKKECATCHANVLEEIDTFKSKHTNLACNDCHSKHGEKPECLNCHTPHLEGQKHKDCLSCHKPHSPLKVAYSPEVPNAFCGACHKKQIDDLKLTSTKHGSLNCAFCHRDVHKTKPSCDNCHGAPHSASILAKFKKCTDCHKDAHLLIK